MQKSGTSLFNQLLMRQPDVNNPFLPEGRFFWGDSPPLNPTDSPCGKLFQAYKGKRGHQLDASDYNPRDEAVLRERIKEANIRECVLTNKNPYNIVRLPWLKATFPESRTVVIVRKPVPHIYSLLKKYEHTENQANLSADGWWGTKPDSWEKLINKNRLQQVTDQWITTMERLVATVSNADVVLEYAQICIDPRGALKDALGPYFKSIDTKQTPKSLRCFDNEYLSGSRLLSKNVEARKRGVIALQSLQDPAEFPPFTARQILFILNKTTPTWNKVENLFKRT